MGNRNTGIQNKSRSEVRQTTLAEKTENYRWVTTNSRQLPQNAFRGGFDKDLELFVARAADPVGNMVGGKVTTALNGCRISYDGKEIIVDNYDVLTIRPEFRNNLVWEYATFGKIPEHAIPTDCKFYIARIANDERITPGKLLDGTDCAYVGYNGCELHSNFYEILCYRA